MMVSPPTALARASTLGAGVGGGVRERALCPNGLGQGDPYFLGKDLLHHPCFSLPSCDWIKHACLPWSKDLDQSREPGAGAAGWGWGVGHEGGMWLWAGPGLVSLRLYRLL